MRGYPDKIKYYFSVWKIDGAYGHFEKVTSLCYRIDQTDMLYSHARHAIKDGYSIRITPIPVNTEVKQFDKRF